MGENMDKKIFMALSMLFMVCAGFSLAGPVAAAKVVDHGTEYGWSGQNGWMKITWTTSQLYKSGKINNNFIKSYATYYFKDHGKYVLGWHEKVTIAKVAKNTVKITDWSDSELGPGTTVTYAKTKLTAAQYYWRVYRYNLIGGLSHVHRT